MTARSRASAVVVSLLAGVVLAVMPAASPAYADEAEDRAAAEVAAARCAKMQDERSIPRQYRDNCKEKLAEDLKSGKASSDAWSTALCLWVPDLPVLGSACKRLVTLMKGAYDEYLARVKTLRETVQAITNPVETAIKNLSDTVANALKSLILKVFTELVHISSPNLASGAFRSSYAAGAGIGMFVLVLMIARVFYRTTSGDLSGEELAESLWRWVPTSVLLVLFGPALGYLLVELTDAASLSIVRYFAGDISSLAVKLQKMIVLSNTGVIPGGPLVSLAIMALAFFGVLGVVAGLLVQLLALYITGSIMAIAFVTMIDPASRPKALRLPMTWIGLLLAKPLLFFLVGALARISDSAFSVQAIRDDGLRAMVTALVAAIALVMLGVAPWSLLKFAPMLPSGTSERTAKASRSSGSGAFGGTASSMMMHLSYRRLQGSAGGGGGGAPAGGSGASAPAGGSSGDALARKAPQVSGPRPGAGAGGDAGGITPAAKPGGSATTDGAGAAASSGSAGAATSGAASGAAGAGAAGSGAAGSGAAGAGAAGATAATGGVAAAALIGVQAVDAAKRATQDAAHRASDLAPGE